jgi:hypothetical protein
LHVVLASITDLAPEGNPEENSEVNSEADAQY